MYQHFDTAAKPFLGKAFKSIERINDSTLTLIFTDGTSSTLSVDGDCCSTSIFYAFELPPYCIGQEILALDQYDKEFADRDEQALAKIKAGEFSDFAEYIDCLSVWDVTFKTKTGTIIIRHINNSNGYYDGIIMLGTPS